VEVRLGQLWHCSWHRCGVKSGCSWHRCVRSGGLGHRSSRRPEFDGICLCVFACVRLCSFSGCDHFFLRCANTATCLHTWVRSLTLLVCTKGEHKKHDAKVIHSPWRHHIVHIFPTCLHGPTDPAKAFAGMNMR